MFWHIILTENCNLNCRYCSKKSNSLEEFENGLDKKFEFDFSEPGVSEIKIEKLNKFLRQDKNPGIIFYGGEPLLQIEKIKEIIEGLKNLNVKYRMQTNGILLDKIPKKYLEKIEKILVSIDGNKERTDLNRGIGTFEKVYENLQEIRKFYRGEIIARMTIAQDCPDIFEQVLNLIKLGFTSIHWQLDVGFYKSDYNKEKIKKFLEDYKKSLKKLINWWFEEINKGNVFRLYPLIGIVKPILEGKKCGLRCGAGYQGYAISTSGKIVACPIMNGIKSFEAGNLDSDIKILKKFSCKEECSFCEVYDLCGGRCMYWRKAKMWPKEGDVMICETIKFYIKKIKEEIPKIKKLIEEKIIKKQDFDYEDFFGPEIIP